MYGFTGTFLTPQVTAALETAENQFWTGRYEQHMWALEVLDNSTVDSGNTNYTTDLRSGLLLGKITSGADAGKVKHWDPAATDGSQTVYGVLAVMVNTDLLGVAKDRLLAVMVGGNVLPERLLIPGQTALGISGNANEYAIKNQMSPRFVFWKDFVFQPMGWRDIQAKTASYTVTAADNGTLFTNRGAAGAVNFTLPATPTKGLRYGFFVVADQNVTVTAGAVNTMIAFNDLDADAIAYTTAGERLGAMVEVIGDGTSWLVINHLGAETQTPTITT